MGESNGQPLSVRPRTSSNNNDNFIIKDAETAAGCSDPTGPVLLSRIEELNFFNTDWRGSLWNECCFHGISLV